MYFLVLNSFVLADRGERAGADKIKLLGSPVENNRIISVCQSVDCGETTRGAGFLLLSVWIWRIAEPEPALADKATGPPGRTGCGREKVLPVREADPVLESD